MSRSQSSIAKNVAALYLRILVNMLIGLYSSRVVLNALGVSDFGVFNIVCGVVVLFSFFNDSMSAATQRFINYALGKGQSNGVNAIFSASVILHVIISLLVVLASETVGLIIVNKYLNLPENRMLAANIIYQVSILCTVLGIIRVPLNSLVIAYEKMTFYAYLSIFETLFKLANIFVLLFIEADKLIIYSFMLLASGFIVFFINLFYVHRHLPEVQFIKRIERTTFQQLLGFSSWTIMGSIANVGAAQGVSFIINKFFGVFANAAIGVANQVNSIVYQFVTNLQLAFNPQTVQSYSQGDFERLRKLIFQNSKYSFYLLYILGLPLVLNIDFVLNFWLGDSVPSQTSRFVSLIIVASLFDAICGSLWTTIQATGRIRNYQIIISILIISVLPVSFCFLWLGYPAIAVYWVNLGMRFVITIFRLGYLVRLHILKVEDIYFSLFRPILIVLLVSLPLCWSIHLWHAESMLQNLLLIVADGFGGGISILFCGITPNERNKLLNKIFSKLKSAF